MTDRISVYANFDCKSRIYCKSCVALLVFDTFKSSVYLLKQPAAGCFFSISIENNVFICYNSKNQ